MDRTRRRLDGSLESLAAFAQPGILVDTAWLADHVDDPKVRIVDARMPTEGPLYDRAHIPGAVYIDMLRGLRGPSRIMSPERFASLMGRLGIGDDTTVVAYDTEGGPWAARLWWALRYHGHAAAALVDGGLRSWVSAGNSLQTEAPVVEAATFTPQLQPSWRATIDEVREAIEDPTVSLVDALPWPHYTGDGGVGHIPSAVNLPATDMLDAVRLTVRDSAALTRMLRRASLDPAQRTITYCGAGYWAALSAFVLDLMGFEDVALYDGSMREWAKDPANPVEIVP